jgi:tetratricopeptide (TPR) repeat protein
MFFFAFFHGDLLAGIFSKDSAVVMLGADYLKAYEYNLSYISALSTIAYCYEVLKDYKKAEEYYEKYLKFAKEGTENYNFAKKGLEYVKGQLFMEETE